MKKIGLLICLLMILLVIGKNEAQSLICNDLVFIALDESCTHTILPEEILEGIVFPNCIVELDKTAPFGNGPWVPGVLGPDDIGKTYQIRVKHLPSGNSCWGNVKAEDKLPPKLKCNGVTTVNLTAGGPVSVAATDLNLTAVDACSVVTLNPANLNYDCGNLGVNTIQLTATDGYGNTSTCNHTVLVTNAADCLTCTSECPESVVVSYDEGNSVLAPAFQNSDWSAFDPFGNALYDPACATYVDSTYTVTYTAGPSGQDWFTRQWVWQDGTGQIVNCNQSILFPNSHTVIVQGTVFWDSDNDCQLDAGEIGINVFGLEIVTLPSGSTNTVIPNADGTYTIEIEFTPADSAAQVHLDLPNYVSTICPNAIDIPNSTSTPVYNFNIGLQTGGDCPVMKVDLGTLFARRCATNLITLQYCNVGLDTAYNAYVEVKLDSLITLESATLPFTLGPNNTATFQLGDLPPFTCGYAYLNAKVSCDAVLGQTLCNSATAFPDTPCGGEWQGPLVTSTAICTGDSVSLSIWNKGQADMVNALEYIVIEDFIMYKDGSFQLDAGDSITIKTKADGSTWRIEAKQIPGFHVTGIVSAAIEGCGGLNTPGAINMFSQSDNALNYDEECSEVVASCDPNDKTAVPVGTQAQHFIRANEVIEYKIRFQNTGTASALKVVVVDSLPAELDARTLEVGASSHPYRLEIYSGRIIHFVFDPIELPDSNANEVASHGFVEFRIAQQPDLPDGTVIENTVGIYFDFNAPVITNTAYHTIGYPFQVSNTWTANAPGLQVTLTPNPFQDQALLAVEGKRLSKGHVLLYNAQGSLLRTQDLTDNRAILYRSNLPAGVYFFQIVDQGIGVAGGKIILD